MSDLEHELEWYKKQYEKRGKAMNAFEVRIEKLEAEIDHFPDVGKMVGDAVTIEEVSDE